MFPMDGQGSLPLPSSSSLLLLWSVCAAAAAAPPPPYLFGCLCFTMTECEERRWDPARPTTSQVPKKRNTLDRRPSLTPMTIRFASGFSVPLLGKIVRFLLHVNETKILRCHRILLQKKAYRFNHDSSDSE